MHANELALQHPHSLSLANHQVCDKTGRATVFILKFLPGPVFAVLIKTGYTTKGKMIFKEVTGKLKSLGLKYHTTHEGGAMMWTNTGRDKFLSLPLYGADIQVTFDRFSQGAHAFLADSTRVLSVRVFEMTAAYDEVNTNLGTPRLQGSDNRKRLIVHPEPKSDPETDNDEEDMPLSRRYGASPPPLPQKIPSVA